MIPQAVPCAPNCGTHCSAECARPYDVRCSCRSCCSCCCRFPVCVRRTRCVPVPPTLHVAVHGRSAHLSVAHAIRRTMVCWARFRIAIITCSVFRPARPCCDSAGFVSATSRSSCRCSSSAIARRRSTIRISTPTGFRGCRSVRTRLVSHHSVSRLRRPPISASVSSRRRRVVGSSSRTRFPM